MSHLFQPGNSLGVGEGRPRKYTDEFLNKELEEFYAWMKLPESIYFKNFCIERGYHPSRLHEFAEEHEGFSRGLQLAKEWQAGKLIQYALFGKTKEGLTKFLLSAVHQMHEVKVEQSAQPNYTIQSTQRDGESKPETTPEL